MTDFIFFTNPWLLAAPLAVFILTAAACAFKNSIVSVTSLIIHAVTVVTLICFGGSLSDILITLLLSVLSLMIFGKSRANTNKNDKEDDK